jgi:hypothetical protein
MIISPNWVAYAAHFFVFATSFERTRRGMAALGGSGIDFDLHETAIDA